MKKRFLFASLFLLVALTAFGFSMYTITGRFLTFVKPVPVQKIIIKKTQSPSGVVTRSEFPSGRIGFFVLGTFLTPIQPTGNATFLVDGDQANIPVEVFFRIQDGTFSIERHLNSFSDSAQAFEVNIPTLETMISSGRKAKLRMVYEPATTNPEEVLAIETFTAALNGTLNVSANLVLRPVGMEIVGE